MTRTAAERPGETITQTRAVAKGHVWRGQRRVVCAFDIETFEFIQSRAVKMKTSFAEQVRTLVEWGIEALE